MATSAETTEVIDNYKAYAGAMFAEGSPYQLAKTDIKELFHEFGLVNAEHGQVLAQTLAQLATSANSEALKAGQSTLTLSKDVALKTAQANLVIRQTKGYDDNLLVKVTEFQSGVTQFAVNAGEATAIQESVNQLNAKVAQVEHRVADLVVVNPVDSVLPAPVLTIGTVTATTIPLTWVAISGATEYVVWVNGVASSGTANLYTTLDGLTASTTYAINIQALVGGTLTRLSTTVMQTTSA